MRPYCGVQMQPYMTYQGKLKIKYHLSFHLGIACATLFVHSAMSHWWEAGQQRACRTIVVVLANSVTGMILSLLIPHVQRRHAPYVNINKPLPNLPALVLIPLCDNGSGNEPLF